MADSTLEEFSKYLKPPEEYVKKIKMVVDDIFRKLQKGSKASLARCRIVGGVEKKTSTSIKADADVVIYYNDENIGKETIINDFRIILGRSESEINRNGTMQFDIDGVPIDLLVAVNHARNTNADFVEVQRINSWKKMEVSGAFKLPGAKTHYGAELSESSVTFMKTKSKFVHDLARLAKFWSQTIIFTKLICGKSLIMELLAVKAAIEEENKEKKPSHVNAFIEFLKKVHNLQSQHIVFEDFYKKCDVKLPYNKNQAPVLMDPVNPYNNLLDMEHAPHGNIFIDVFARCAAITLKDIESKGVVLSSIFDPCKMHNKERIDKAGLSLHIQDCMISVENSSSLSKISLGHRLTSKGPFLMPQIVQRRNNSFLSNKGDLNELVNAIACFVVVSVRYPRKCYKTNVWKGYGNIEKEDIRSVNNFIANLSCNFSHLKVKDQSNKGSMRDHEESNVTIGIPLEVPTRAKDFAVFCISINEQANVASSNNLRRLDGEQLKEICRLDYELAQSLDKQWNYEQSSIIGTMISMDIKDDENLAAGLLLSSKELEESMERQVASDFEYAKTIESEMNNR